jgi:adenylylsulfate kinase
MAGEIAHFTGIDDPYEEPLDPEILVETDQSSVLECVHFVLGSLERADLLKPDLASLPAAKDRT